MKSLKSTLNRIIQKAVYRYRSDSESYVNYLKKCGILVGEDVNFYSPSTTSVDIQNPHLLKIGSHVHITGGVTILTHDFSWSVLKRIYGEILGSEGEVVIGDNCFIGINSTIMRNTHIGDNVIIGAHSLVSGFIPSNSVVAGNPAKVIMSIDEFYKKRKALQDSEIINCIKLYQSRFNTDPDINVLSEYFWMFTNKKEDLSNKCFMQMQNCGNYQESIDLFTSHTPKYDGLQDIIKK